MIRWFIGYDPREAVAYHTLSQSLLERSSVPVQITPLALGNLRSIFRRDRNPLQSNDFSFSRFLVPFLCNYSGHAIYSDCDMLIRRDPADLWGLIDMRMALQCVQHDHQPSADRKYLGNVQTVYPRKNWSSLMLLNCWRLRSWTPEAVATRSGLELHRFNGIADTEIGALPPTWNHLVGSSKWEEDPALVHWTSGGPYFSEYAQVAFAAEWWDTFRRARHADDAAEQLYI